MSSLVEDLQECVNGLQSKKISTQRECLEKLNNLIKYLEIIKFLNSNNAKPNRLHWSTIFDLIFELLFDFEKRDQKKKSRNSDVFYCAEIINTIIEKSCENGKLDVSLSYIVSNLLNALNNSSNQGNTFINILQKITDIPQAAFSLQTNVWNETFALAKKLLSERLSDKASIGNIYDVIRLFKSICRNCPPISIKRCPSFLISLWLKEDFIKNATHQNKQELLEITYIVSKKLLVDSRISICKMGEKILPQMLLLYEKRSEEYGGIKSLIFDNCLIQMIAHHPKGTRKGSNLAFATTWLDWERLINKIYFILRDEAVSISKSIKYKLASSNNLVWDNYCRLFVEVLHQKLFNDLNESREDEHPTVKKPRPTNVFDLILEEIAEENGFGLQPWLVVLHEFLTAYPEDVTPIELEFVLQKLLKIKCTTVNDNLSRIHCFTAILKAQLCQTNDENFTVDSWKIVWDIITRSIGNKENIDACNELLQLLIEKNVFDTTPIIRVFNSCQFPSVELLKTFSILFRYEFLTVSNEIIDEKEKIWTWLMPDNVADAKKFSLLLRSNATTRLLAGLVLKEFPKIDLGNVEVRMDDFSEDIECLARTLFDEELMLKASAKSCEPQEYRVDEELVRKYDTLLLQFVATNESLSDSVENSNAIFDRLIFCLNLSSAYLEYAIISEIDHFILAKHIENLMESLAKILKTLLTKSHDNLAIVDFLEQLANVYSLNVNVCVQKYLRKIASRDFLQAIFNISHTEENQDFLDCDSSSQMVNTKKKNGKNIDYLIVDVICKFIFVPGSKELLQGQRGCLKTIFNTMSVDSADLKIKLLVLESLTLTSVGSLKINFVKNALQVFNTLINAACRNQLRPNMMESLLKSIKGFVGHVFSFGDSELEFDFFQLFNELFSFKFNYPKLIILFLRCVETIIGINSNLNQNEHMKSSIFSFLEKIIDSPYQCVRMAVIEIFSTIFNTMKISQNEKHELFKQFDVQIQKLFEVSESIVKGNKEDEIICRTSSVFHYYIIISVSQLDFRIEGLSAILALTKTNGISINLIRKVLNNITVQLNIASVTELLNPHIEFLFYKWQSRYNIVDFPFQLLNCGSEVEFFTKYIGHVLLVCLNSGEMTQLERISKICGKKSSDLLKANFAALYAQILPLKFNILNGANDEQSTKKKLEHIQQTISKYLTESDITTLFNQEIQNIFLHSIQLLNDPIECLLKFGLKYENKIQDSLTYSIKTLNNIKSRIEIELSSKSLVKTFATHSPCKIEIILRTLSNCLFKTTSENDTFIALHHYAYFTDEILANFCHAELDSLTVYTIRQVSFTLIYLIQANKSVVINNAAARYLKSFCSECVVKCKQNHFKTIFNSLIHMIVPIVECSVDLMDLLEFMIVENSHLYSEAIAKLDPLPNEPRFREIQAKLNEIRAQSKIEGSKLKREIIHFLNVDGSENVSRLEGLKHLTQELSMQKKNLKLLYDELKENNGLFKDNESILHRLVQILVKLSVSSDEQLSIEAAKCLGELGPSDLTTFVLKVENMNITKYYEEDMRVMVVGYLLEKMCELQVDRSLNVREQVSKILYAIFQNSIGHCTLCEDHIHIKYNRGCLQTDLLTPFIPKTDDYKTENLKILGGQFRILQDPNIWWPGGDSLSHHEKWIKNLVIAILRSFISPTFFQLLIPLCQEKLDFVELLFPLFIELLLSQRSIVSKCIFVNDQINMFFERFWNGEKVHRLSLQVLLSLVHLNKFRTQRNKPNESKEFLKLNFLHVAKAAQYCGAHLSTIFYAELWCQNFTAEPYRLKWSNTMLDQISENSLDDAVAVRNILREAYVNIGDKDAINGCDSIHLIHLQNRTDYYELNGLCFQALLHQDLTLANKNSSQQDKSLLPLLKTLKTAGLYHLADIYTKSQNLSDDYDCAWRLGNWTLVDRGSKTNFSAKVISTDLFENYHYFALKSLAENESPKQYLHLSRQCVIESFRNESLESTNNLYSALSKLQMIQEIDDFFICMNQHSTISETLTKWHSQLEIGSNDFTLIEPILKQRIRLLQILLKKHQNISTWNSLAKLQIDSAEMAHQNNLVQVAKPFLFEIPVEKISTDMHYAVKFVEAKLEYSLDKNIGRSLLQQLLNANDFSDYKLRSKIFQTYGKWMMETRSENPDKYFQRALDILNDLNSPTDRNDSNRFEAYDAIARFADGEYQQVRNFLKSPACESKLKCIEQSKAVYLQLSNRYKDFDPTAIPREDRRIMIQNEKCATIDEMEINNFKEDLDKNLKTAMKYYLLSLINCDDYNLRVYRVVALWFENRTHEGLDKLLSENLPSVPVHKFLPILAQIAPHISNQKNNFTEKVASIIERCVIDHPHHALPIMMALALTNKHESYDGRQRNEKKIRQPRVIQAQAILKNLHRNSTISKNIDEMIQMSDALIRLAYLPISSDHIIPSNQPIRKLNKLDCISVPTLDIPIRPSGNYTEIIRIYKWKEKYTPVGGINAPKKITCIGSNGIEYSQLIKGEDDLRQDAVMQQVFSIMNTLLNRSGCRNLLIRTYKVVPLSQKSGLLEWCSNTIPLFEYLVGKPLSPGVHQRYYPQDLTPYDCRLQMHEARTLSNELKLKAFQRICQKFRPAFHHFFWEQWGNAAIWWSRRRSYTLSVAVTSIVGYILGIGDRHLSNILIDCETARVIHIDFGIAFEQGKILPTPETVPFRLTRDIEDGMGVLGVEGVFRRSCEKTMQILRNNSEIILTILEVLLYDPLYMWAITPSKAVDIQRGLKDETDAAQKPISDVEVNQSAERALLRLTQKLQGSEEGRITSIEGQVERLLQQARDPANLCRLFSGWQPYL